MRRPDPDRQADLLDEFMDHYSASETREAIHVFLRGIAGPPPIEHDEERKAA